VATRIHLIISIICAGFLVLLTARLDSVPASLAGIVFGVILYAVNLYGFTVIFPWFAQARGWITLIAHGVFGLTAVSAHRCLILGTPFNNARHQPDGH